MNIEQIKSTLEAYEDLCEHAGRIAEAYILATAKDAGNIQRYAPDFEFPCASGLEREDAKFYASWTETWAYGGYEEHHKAIPMRLLLMPEDEALAEIQKIADAKAREKAEKEAKQLVAKEARERAELERLQAKYEQAS